MIFAKIQPPSTVCIRSHHMQIIACPHSQVFFSGASSVPQASGGRILRLEEDRVRRRLISSRTSLDQSDGHSFLPQSNDPLQRRNCRRRISVSRALIGSRSGDLERRSEEVPNGRDRNVGDEQGASEAAGEGETSSSHSHPHSCVVRPVLFPRTSFYTTGAAAASNTLLFVAVPGRASHCAALRSNYQPQRHQPSQSLCLWPIY